MLDVNIRKRVKSFTLDVRFTAENGKVLGLLGASGCGKSFTLQNLAGIVKPDSGTVTLNNRVLYDSGSRVNLPPQKRKIGYLFQNYALFPNMTALQNVIIAVPGGTAAEKRSIAMSLLESVRLGGAEQKRPGELSGGMRQRVAIARLLASKPEVLCLDEPFSALDSYLRWQTELEISDILREYMGPVILVSHSRDEVYRLCDNVCVISEGRSGEVRPVKELFSEPKTLAAALISGCKNYSRITNEFLIDWNCGLPESLVIDPGAKYIGVRAHYIIPKAFVPQGNSAPGITIKAKVTRIIDDTFGTIIMLNTGMEGEFAQIRMELSKSDWLKYTEEYSAGEIDVFIKSGDIMFLKG